MEINFSGDGNVSFEEFVDIAWSAGAGATATGLDPWEQEEKELRDAFRVFDKHNRGYISASDLRAVLQCLGEDLSEEESKKRRNVVRTDRTLMHFRSFPVEDMIKEVDVDGDGRIDFYGNTPTEKVFVDNASLLQNS